MTKLILTLILFVPLMASAVGPNYQSSLCDHENYRLGARGLTQILFCLREAFSAASVGKISPETITYQTRIDEVGGFTAETNKTLDRRLRLLGFPDSKFLDTKEIAQDSTLADLLELLKQGWSETYCR